MRSTAGGSSVGSNALGADRTLNNVSSGRRTNMYRLLPAELRSREQLARCSFLDLIQQCSLTRRAAARLGLDRRSDC